MRPSGFALRHSFDATDKGFIHLSWRAGSNRVKLAPDWPVIFAELRTALRRVSGGACLNTAARIVLRAPGLERFRFLRLFRLRKRLAQSGSRAGGHVIELREARRRRRPCAICFSGVSCLRPHSPACSATSTLVRFVGEAGRSFAPGFFVTVIPEIIGFRSLVFRSFSTSRRMGKERDGKSSRFRRHASMADTSASAIIIGDTTVHQRCLA
jgi:hypothetical protein